MSGKRIVFNTSTPNDQGGIIPNEAIDFTRFNKNPVLLLEHSWGSAPLGIMTDIKIIDGKYTGVPVFHRLTDLSRQYADMYEGGFIKACSIGGFSEWKTNAAGQPQLDRDGNRVCAKFDLYEISICSLPSNQDAVTLSALEPDVKIYEKTEMATISYKITTLSTQFKLSQPMDKTPEQLAAEKAAADKLKAAEDEVTRLKAEKEKLEARAGGASEVPNELPGVLQTILSFAKDLLGLKADKVEATTGLPEGSTTQPTPAKQDPTTITLPKTTLKSDKAKKDMDDAKDEAEKAVEKAKQSKTKADAEDASDEMKSTHAANMAEAQKALNHAVQCEATYNAALKEEADALAAKPAPEKTTNAATPPAKPQMKTLEELKAEQVQLAAAPDHRARVNSQQSRGLTFSALHSAWEKDPNSGDGRIFSRVMTTNAGAKDIADYAVVLNSIINDEKYKAVIEKTRLNMNVGQAEMPSLMANPKLRGGLNLLQLAAKLNNGSVSVMGRDNVLREQTNLTSTDTLLASPDLFAVEWLPMAIFQLFPSNSWKQDIPVFSAQETGNNTGLIWANVAADPTIYKGAQPNNPSNYSYTDTAVALTLAPYWLQPMIWTPMTMHQLRYDQMSTGWAQAFAKWGTVMDDNLIYTLASTVPAGAVVPTSGSSFVPGSGANKFYYNPSFATAIKAPAYNDIFALEQVYNNQNFNLDNEKPILVIDPIMTRYIKQDPDTKSLLTRFIKSDESEVLKIGNTTLIPRSRVAVYDPSTSQVKDPNASIPSTASSAAIGFIPSNVGIGLGMLDVFMVQSPGAYGYIMSADTRIGIVPLRANFNGTSLYTYGS